MSSLSSQLEWLDGLGQEQLPRLLGSRVLEIALASDLLYVTVPRVWDGAIQATLGKDPRLAKVEPRQDAFSVAIQMNVMTRSLLGSCSRCMQSFGPCPHASILAVDLALSPELRQALRRGEDVRPFAQRAPQLRVNANLERSFEAALGDWLKPAEPGTPLEISASVEPVDPYMRYGLGGRNTAIPDQVIALTVRRRGERKLIGAREVLSRGPFQPRDRRVLEHVHDLGTGKKALYAFGLEASITLEAIRVHGSIFAGGFKRRLEFRPDPLRPSVQLEAKAEATVAVPDAFDKLSAVWVSDGGARVPFSDSTFFAGPFPFVWTKDGTVYPVAPGVDLDLASRLAARSVLHVPPGRLEAVGAKLLRATHGRGIAMPEREAFGLTALDTPRFALRLVGEPLNFEGELAAIYRAREIILAGKTRDHAPPDETRDLESEARALAALRRASLLPPEDGRDAEDGQDDSDDAGDEPLVLRDEGAVAFWQKGLLDLRDETDPAIDVVLSESLARVRVGAPLESRVRVSLEGNWLDTRLEFSSGELGVELGAIREALAKKRRWVHLSDGSLSRISASIEALSEESNLVMQGKAEARLPAHQLGRIDRWLEENDGRVDAHVEALRKRLKSLAVSAEPTMPTALTATLRDYQRRGLAWLQFLQALGAGGILADDMGLGKTITTLAFLLQRKEAEGGAPSLVVCPTSVAGNWLRESARFTPDLKTLLLHGATRKRDHARIPEVDVVVTTYALLRRDLSLLETQPFRLVVLDEAQNIKNADAATTRAAAKLQATMRLALSGTPMENRLAELWSLASFANPGILGTLTSFEKRFERPIVANPQCAAATELRALVRPFLLRRTKDDVLRELPPKTEIDRMVTLRREDKRMYDALAHALRTSVAKDIEKRAGQSSLSVFTALTRLRQMACDPRLVDPKSPPSASAKREAFLELVRVLVAEGRRALVFSQFVQLLTLWRKDLDAEGFAYEYLDGSTINRDAIVARFQEGSAPLFLISLKAGGSGLNLTAADTVIHCDPWWNPAVEDQATDRTHRIGQDKPVTVVRLVARGTIEEKILALKAKKRELTHAVIGDDAGALSGLTQDDIRRLLGDAEDDVTDEDDDAPPGANGADGAATDKLASAKEVLLPEYGDLVVYVKQWLATSGRLESDLALLVDIPPAYASRLVRGEPFPCSRSVARRIRERLRDW
jgi:superfamily II DNA or RNA helicase